jgi:hypothetical protein
MMKSNFGFGGDAFNEVPAAIKQKKKRVETKKVRIVPKQDRYFSSDEEVWESELDPVINLFACGWLEDGRCGLIDDDPGVLLL